MSPDRQLDPMLVLEAFGLPDGKLLAIFAGFSAATVWHVESGQHHFALKAYQPDWGDACRLMAIHQRVNVAGPDLMPLPLVTKYRTTVVESQNRLWDCTPWLAGQPVNKIDATVIETVVRLHTRWKLPPLPSQPSDTVARHWSMLDTWNPDMATPSHDGLSDAHDLLLRHLDPCRALLRPWLNRPVPMQTIHGDLWPGNVLMHDGHVSGIIDCAAIRVDTVVSDLARLFGNMDKDAKQIIADTYEPQRPLQPVEWELLDLLSRTGPVVRLAQWLKWLTVERRPFADAGAAQRRFLDVADQCRAAWS